MDRLRPEEQLTLKVASVLGLTIYRQLLQARPGLDCWVGSAPIMQQKGRYRAEVSPAHFSFLNW